MFVTLWSLPFYTAKFFVNENILAGDLFLYSCFENTVLIFLKRLNH